jgi:hypothetical protein
MTHLWTLTAAVVACCTLLAGPVLAVPIVGSSHGTFSGLSSCDNSGFFQNCRITGSTNGPNTQVQWGSTSILPYVNPSTLTAVDVTIDRVTPANDVILARLDWYNSATWAQDDLDLFGVNWLLTVTFTQPTGTGDHEEFSLSISNPINPPGDHVTGLTLGDLSNLSFSLAGVTVSDLKYTVVDSTGPGISTLSFNNGNGNWYNPENNSASLLITADFTANGGWRLDHPCARGRAGDPAAARRRPARAQPVEAAPEPVVESHRERSTKGADRGALRASSAGDHLGTRLLNFGMTSRASSSIECRQACGFPE